MEAKELAASNEKGEIKANAHGKPILQDSRPEISQTAQAFQDIVFGSIAGIIGKFIEYPFDTVKVRLQSQPEARPPLYTGPLDCFRQSIRSDGLIGGLYRGISAPLIGAAIETSSLFFSYRLAQEALQATLYNGAAPLPMSALCLSGAASGAFTSLLLTPIELVKCKMQVPIHEGPLAKQPGPFSIIASVFRHQGFLGFWRGQLGTLIRETGGSAAWFGSFEGVSLFFWTRAQGKANEGEDDVGARPLPIYQQLLAGATAGMSYNFVFYPADTIKSRMQTEDATAAKAQGTRRSFGAVGKALVKEQGIRGLYKGCGITVGRAAPSSAFIFTVYEGLKQSFGS